MMLLARRRPVRGAYALAHRLSATFFRRGTASNAGDTDGPQPMSRFGAERLTLAKQVALILNEMPSQPRYFLDNGTLLGLWRDGELIDNDDDFDFGLLVDGAEFSPDWVVEFQRDFQTRLSQLTSQYRSRIVDSYAHKIEIFDPGPGSFPLRGEKYCGARYHHVSVDLQLHVEEVEDRQKDQQQQKAEALKAGKVILISGEVLTGGVTIQHSDFASRGQAPGDAYEPFGSVCYAGADWPVPAKQETFLRYLYGYVGKAAVFDCHSMLYRKQLVANAGQEHTGGEEESLPVLRLYTDMCADLFHTGHVNYLRQCRAVAERVHLTVGIHSDATIESYKRASICTMEERIGVVEACEYVDVVLADAPLRVTEAFMDEHAIDFVIHGTETPEAERQAMYDVPIGRGMYTEVPRTGGISTTELIDRVASRLEVDFEENALPSKRQTVLAVVRQITDLQAELAFMQGDRMDEIRKQGLDN
jgi:cytidyltransferase-like protein